MSLPRLLVIITSTRPNRFGKAIGDWFVASAEENGLFDVEVADLAKLNLPFVDEPHHPRLRSYVHDHTKKWSATVEAADAVVWVMPEYNYSLIAPMKNAIDYLSVEWSYLPTSFVSYGGVSGGLRGVESAKQPLRTLGAVTTNAAVVVPFAGAMMKDGHFNPSEAVEISVAPMLSELLTLHDALKGLRAAKLAH